MNVRLMAWTTAVMASAALTKAHPGHGPFSEGTNHFITSPSHLGVVLLICATLFAGAQFLKAPRQRAIVRTIATLVAAVAIAL